MIGSGLRKLAQENGMSVSHGVAYGIFHGFAATFSEGSGYKKIVFTTKFAEPEKVEALQTQLNQRNISREFRVQNLSITPNGIGIIFLDNPGTMKKMQEFLNWFIPLLKEAGASGGHVCTECGCEVTSGRWVLINGVAYYMHESCTQKIQRDIAAEEETRKQEDTGSYAKGVLGALGGSLLGAVVWAFVLYMGYMASLVGLLIGWLAEKGYNLLHGKQGKAKVLILIIAIILGVFVGTFAAEAIAVAEAIDAGLLGALTYADIVPLIILVLMEDAEVAAAVFGNVLMGLFFAGLGVFALLRKTGKAVSGTKFTYLT